jgi:hypothetical protein
MATDGFQMDDFIEVVRSGSVGMQKINGKENKIPLPVGTILKLNYVGAFILCADGYSISGRDIYVHPADVKDIGDRRPEQPK